MLKNESLRHRSWLRSVLGFVAALAIAGCGGGGGGGGGGAGSNANGTTPNGSSGPVTAVGTQMGGGRQVATLSVNASAAAVSTLAGKLMWTDGVGAAAAFQFPYSLAFDGTNLYVADTFNQVIRKINPVTGAVSTFAGAIGQSGNVDGAAADARFKQPYGIASDGTNLYVADTLNGLIRQIEIATGTVTTLAGGGTGAKTDGIGTSATFHSPKGIACDGPNLYVADTNNYAIRKIVIASREVSTLAGGIGGNADGTGAAARFNWPTGVAVSGGTLFVADYFNNSVRQLDIATGVVTTFAGSTTGASGSVDGIGTAARFHYPQGVATDGVNVYVIDTGNYSVRKIAIATQSVSTWVGSTVAGHADGIGAAASFINPTGGVIAGGSLYVADNTNSTIRKVVLSSGAVTTLAGTWPGVDGTGTAASFNSPSGITSDGVNLYVTDMYNNNIRKIVIATGEVGTFAGSPSGDSGYADGFTTAALFNQPEGITTDGVSLFVVDNSNNNIRQIDIGSGRVTTLAGSRTGAFGNSDGSATSATFNSPVGITTDGAKLYVADGQNSNIREIVIATGAVSTFAGSTSKVRGGADGIGTSATFTAPKGITTDGTNLYVVDETMSSVRKIVLASKEVSTLAGSQTGATGSANGTGTAASFLFPYGVTTDGTKLYVTDSVNNTIRQIVIATGEVSTLTGRVLTDGAGNGPAATATFYRPAGITTDGHSLYVVDSYNKVVRKIQ